MSYLTASAVYQVPAVGEVFAVQSPPAFIQVPLPAILRQTPNRSILDIQLYHIA